MNQDRAPLFELMLRQDVATASKNPLECLPAPKTTKNQKNTKNASGALGLPPGPHVPHVPHVPRVPHVSQAHSPRGPWPLGSMGKNKLKITLVTPMGVFVGPLGRPKGYC